MLLALQFSPSTFVCLEITCKYIWPCSAFHWDQTQIHQSSIPEWLLFEYRWCQKGRSFFARKVDFFHHYPMSLWVLYLICWIFRVLTCRYFGKWTRRVWDHFYFTSCGLGTKLLSYLSLFLFLYWCLLLFSFYKLNDSALIPLCLFGFNYIPGA